MESGSSFSPRVASRGPTRANGQTWDNVEVWTPDGSHRTLYFDPGTLLLAGVEMLDVACRRRGVLLGHRLAMLAERPSRLALDHRRAVEPRETGRSQLAIRERRPP